MPNPLQGLFAARYQRLSEPLAGGTAKVYKAFDHETQAIVALKIFTSEGRDPAVVNEIWNREHSALSKLEHDAVVRMIDAGRDEITSERYIALEWIDGATLEEHLKQRGPLTWEAFFERYGEPILSALVHAAERNVIHRDLSTSNVLVTASGALKIIDFGQAKLSDNIIGRTVMGFKTVPYCLPEDDTGTYTYTRDPYAFSAIGVRAVAGRALLNHEELYAELGRIDLPTVERTAIVRALSREPSERYKTIVEFYAAMTNRSGKVSPDLELPAIPLRLAPTLAEKLRADDDADEEQTAYEEAIAVELSEIVAVAPALENPTGTRLQFETRSYRLIADVDATRQDHLVVVGAVKRLFRQLDAIFQAERWMPSLRFTTKLPRIAAEQRQAREAIAALYGGLESHISERRRAERRDAVGSISDWNKLLEALRFIAKHSVPPLKYTSVEKDGTRLIAVIENPEDAVEEQLRTISVDKSWVFRGEIESIRGSRCILQSTRPFFDIDRIPSKGTLEIDWQQTKVALDRQARALDKFRENETPSPRLRELLTGVDAGPAEPSFRPVGSFFDQSLDDPKKTIVSRFLAGSDLIVAHGPPGTGKTKLIVELVRQAIKADPECRILLASQTHVALDNALQRLLAVDKNYACVRIGSGSKDLDERVASCSLTQRSIALREHVSKSAQLYLETRATELGISKKEVELGLLVLDVIGARAEQSRKDLLVAELTSDLKDVMEGISNDDGKTSDERSALVIRGRELDDELEQAKAELVLAKGELEAARQKLISLGSDGKALADTNMDGLREWSDVLMSDERHHSLGKLMQLSEQWRMRFGQSDDFKAAIISSSSIVAGTCVGFCREDAASRATFDLCIIDEAGKATTTELLVPLAQSKRAVLFGDHHQLPAVLDYSIRSQEMMERFGLREENLDEQLFETLTKDLADGCKSSLTVQYRMRGEIGRLVSESFYDGKLLEHESLQNREVVDLAEAGLESEVTWIDPYPGNWMASFEQKHGTSYRSIREVQCIIALLRNLQGVFQRTLPGKDWPSIGIISGYAAQVMQIRNAIRKDQSLDKLDVDCSSVHAFQGREVDICIYSVTRKNSHGQIGMLKDWRHLNVALSRAKNFLVIVGSLEFCRSVEHDNPFDRIIKFFDSSPDSSVKEWSDG